MKKVLGLLLIAMFAFGALACDDDDSGGPCDELADKMQGLLDQVCDEYPDCSICEPADVEEGEEGEVDEDACQEVLDNWTDEYEQQIVDGYEMVCEMEAE